MEQGGEGRFLVFLGLSHVYRRPHVIKLVFVFILLICLFTGALSQEPRRVEGKLFFLPYTSFLNQSKRVLIVQLCPTLCDHMGSSVHRILQARILEWVAISFFLQGIFLPQGLNPGLLDCRQILCHRATREHSGTFRKYSQ